MLEEFDEQLRGIRGDLGMSGECCEEILIGGLWAPHSSFLAIGVSPPPADRFLVPHGKGLWVFGEDIVLFLVDIPSEGRLTLPQITARGNRRIKVCSSYNIRGTSIKI
jgi:hypothetical protein